MAAIPWKELRLKEIATAERRLTALAAGYAIVDAQEAQCGLFAPAADQRNGNAPTNEEQFATRAPTSHMSKNKHVATVSRQDVF